MGDDVRVLPEAQVEKNRSNDDVELFLSFNLFECHEKPAELGQELRKKTILGFNLLTVK
jgi:hypothetical protein